MGRSTRHLNNEFIEFKLTKANWAYRKISNICFSSPCWNRPNSCNPIDVIFVLNSLEIPRFSLAVDIVYSNKEPNYQSENFERTYSQQYALSCKQNCKGLVVTWKIECPVNNHPTEPSCFNEIDKCSKEKHSSRSN